MMKIIGLKLNADSEKLPIRILSTWWTCQPLFPSGGMKSPAQVGGWNVKY